MTDIAFTPFPKIARLNRAVIITEKIDGTNAAVGVTEDGPVYAQSRKRLITPDDDNYGFAGWVRDHAKTRSYQRYQCDGCGKWQRGRNCLNTTEITETALS